MANGGHPEALKILGGEMAQVFSTDLVLAEGCLVAFQTQVSQPTCDIHRRFLRLGDARGEVSPYRADRVQEWKNWNELGLPMKQGFRPRLAASCRPTVAIWCHRPFSGRRGLEGLVQAAEGQLTFHPGLRGDVFLRMTGLWVSPPHALPGPPGLAQALQDWNVFPTALRSRSGE